MAFFMSTFTNKIDQKGRISVPASFRATLGEQLEKGIVLFASHRHNCLEGFDWEKMEEISEQIDHYDLFSDDQDDLATTILGQSVRLLLDENGRMLLPEPLIKAADLKEQATFVGLGRKFQIWSPEQFEERQNQARSAVQKKNLTIPQKLSKGGV